MTLTLAIWLYIKVNAHPLAIDNNCVKYDLYLTMGLEFNARTLCDQTEILTDWQTDRQPIGPINKNLVEDIGILLPVKFRWIPLIGFKGEVENVPPNQRSGGNLGFPMGPKNYPTNVIEDVDILLTVKFRWIPFSGFEVEMSHPSEAGAVGFSIGQKTKTW